MPDDYTKVIAPMGFQKAAIYTIERFNLNQTAEEILAEWNSIAIRHYEKDIELKDGAKEYLLFLKNKGVKLAVATASEYRLFSLCLKHHGILDIFDNITMLTEVSRGKGFPDIHERAAKKMNLKAEECVVFEDIYLGIKGAKDGNFKAVCMYDKTSEADREKSIALCDKYIYSFKEMM